MDGYPDSKLSIRGLPQDMTEEDLEKICGDFGGVKRCHIIRDETNEISYGTCEYEDVADATKAIPCLKELTFNGKNLEVAGTQFFENCNIIVQNLPVWVSEAAFQKTFEQFGKITKCRVVMNGYKNAEAFCSFEKGFSAQKAIDEFNGKTWPRTVQKILTVRFADSEESEGTLPCERPLTEHVEDNQECKHPGIDVEGSSKEQQKESVMPEISKGNEGKTHLVIADGAVAIQHKGVHRAIGENANVIDLRKPETVREKDATSKRDSEFMKTLEGCNITVSGNATLVATGGVAEASGRNANVYRADNVDDIIKLMEAQWKAK